MAKFSKEEKIILLIIFFAFVVGVLFNFLFSYKNKIKEVSVKKEQMLININTADENELSKLPGIGLNYAKKIMEYRKENGNFEKIEDIMKVKGIGKKKFEKIKNFIKVDE